MTAFRIHFLEHAPHERPGSISDWARDRGYEVSGSRLYLNDPLPKHQYFHMLVVLGGPMSVKDVAVYPWLKEEKHFIERAIEHSMPVLGICLGAQLIADVLGAEVTPMIHKEIGWHEVVTTPECRKHSIASTFPERFPAFHWHGEMFSIPDGAINIGHSHACIHQGFTLADRVVALQFHPEITPRLAESFVREGAHELLPAPHIQDSLTIMDGAHRYNGHHHFFTLLDRLASTAGAP
jgi:GMP synthase-like glutamine amidotransferase